jgi:hypothetical protein
VLFGRLWQRWQGQVFVGLSMWSFFHFSHVTIM